jgi:hypothetical protein
VTPEMPAFEPRPSRLLRPARPDCANQIMTPPSVIIPRSATELKKAKQLNGTASARNKSRFMPNVSVSGFAAQLHSSPPRRSDNAVDRNQRPMSNARRNVAGGTEEK